jgi:D-threo-aldose 1-dehydrogenase
MTKLTIKRTFGQTGLQIPPIVYGTSYLGNLYTALSEKVKSDIVSKWFECTEKPVFIDTAGKYGAGLALEVIGKMLDRLGTSPGDIVISNKLGWYRIPLSESEPTFEPGVWAGLEHDAVQKISYTGILECRKQGNYLLGGKYHADLLSVHDPDEYLAAAKDIKDREKRLQDILSAYRALFELKENGKIRAVGIGAKDWRVIKELYEYMNFDWVMIANKFTLYHHPKEIIEFIETLQSDGVGIINSAVFNAGFLTGGSFFDYKKADPSNPLHQPLFEWRRKFHNICEKFKVKPADACIKFGISHAAISAVALNTSKPDKMHDNVNTLMNDLPEQFWKELKDNRLIDPEYKYI